MLNIDELIAKLQSTGANVNINIINVGVDDTDVDDVDDTPASDFAVGDRVLVCHIKKDGSGSLHTDGIVSDIAQDDTGWYVRVYGDNGKHYRCGLHLDEVRKGTQIIRKL